MTTHDKTLTGWREVQGIEDEALNLRILDAVRNLTQKIAKDGPCTMKELYIEANRNGHGLEFEKAIVLIMKDDFLSGFVSIDIGSKI